MNEKGSVDKPNAVDGDLPPVQQSHETEKVPSTLESSIKTDSSAKDVHGTKITLLDKELSVTERTK